MLSIVLIVRDPGDTAASVITALSEQVVSKDVELIIVDGRPAPSSDVSENKLRAWSIIHAPGENMPRLKAIGTNAATGSHIAYLEPKAVPSQGWLSAVLNAVNDNPMACLGGPVSLDSENTPANQAAYIFEYGMFTLDKVVSRQAQDLPGNNMVLPREPLLDICAEILEMEGLNKPFCQQRLKDNGHAVLLIPEMEVSMVTKHRLKGLLNSRFNYARCFGGTRISLCSPARRWLYRLGAPAIPFILLLKHFRTAIRTQTVRASFAAYLTLAVLCITWSLGEALGYWFGPGASCKRLY